MEYPKKVYVERWYCGLGHYHQTEQAARNCYDEDYVSKKREDEKVRRERAIKAYRLYEEEFSYAEIGRRIGKVKNPEEPIYGIHAKSLIVKGARYLGRKNPFSKL